MKRAVVRIDGKRYGKDDLPPSQEHYGWGRLPDGPGLWKTEADQAMGVVISEDPQTRPCELRVHVDGFDATFHNWAEYKYLLWVFGQPNMPRGFRLTGVEKPGTANNRHWLSRLPADMKTWSFRRIVVAFLTGSDQQVQRYITWHLERGATPPMHID